MRARQKIAAGRPSGLALAAGLLLFTAGCHRQPAPAVSSVASANLRPAAKPALSGANPDPANPQKADPGAALPPLLGPVQLQPQPDVVAGEVEAFPRVLSGPAVTPEIAIKINSALSRDEAAAKATLIECRDDLKQQQPDLKKKDLADAWQRSVDVTMRGPRFLSYTMATSEFCGGAYPELDRSSSIVYDLATGKPVNWLRLLPRGTKGVQGVLGDGLPAGWLQIPSLQRRTLQEAEPECKEIFNPDFGASISFEVYPNARDGSLNFNTPDIEHARRECETTFSLREVGA